MKYSIHKLSDVQSVKIGENTSIWQYTVVLSGASIGKNCNINAHCFIENDVVIGDNVTVKCGVYLWDGLVIESNSFIGPNVTFTNDQFPRSKKYPNSFNKTTIGFGASIGANATVVGGVKIGMYSMVGAGSVVTKDVPAYSLCYGVPAKVVGYVCECGSKLDGSYKCKNCNKLFNLDGDKLSELQND